MTTPIGNAAAIASHYGPDSRPRNHVEFMAEALCDASDLFGRVVKSPHATALLDLILTAERAGVPAETFNAAGDVLHGALSRTHPDDTSPDVMS